MFLPTDSAYVRHQASRRRDCGGLIHAGRAIPFGALAEGVERCASQLASAGIGRGDRVLVTMANHPGLIAAMYACWSHAAVVVPINSRSTVAETEHVAGAAAVSLAIADPERAGLARATGLPTLIVSRDLRRPRWQRQSHSFPSRPPRSPRPDDLAVITYTSGTTGKPKGVMLSHANLLWAALTCATARGDSAEGVGACLSPLTHIPVFVSHLLCRVLLGQTAVLVEKFDIDEVLDAVERHAITDLTLIAGMVFEVIQRGRIAPRRRRSVRKVSIGGAATPMDAKRKLAEIFAGAEIIEAYGQSESTNGVCMARGSSVFDRPGTVGRMNPYVDVRVRRPDLSIAAPDEEGELVVGGPTVMRGYFRDRPGTAAQIRDGWLHTGDLGRADADGYFYITGRVKDLIITGGENVSPAEVEEVLRRHPHVGDVAVIGTPHPRWGEQITAIVVPRNGAPRAPDALADFAGRYLAGFKKPRRIEYVDVLPRNATNKVQTGVLKQMFARKEGR